MSILYTILWVFACVSWPILAGQEWGIVAGVVMLGLYFYILAKGGCNSWIWFALYPVTLFTLSISTLLVMITSRNLPATATLFALSVIYFATNGGVTYEEPEPQEGAWGTSGSESDTGTGDSLQ